ncbi:MAG: DoxX family protein [Myxococcota bacterium]
MSQGKSRVIGFWVATGAVALPNVAAAFGYLSANESVMQNFANLGYPAYLPTFLGIMKIAGALALFVRKVPVLTQWAYAGFTFVFLGAVYSHLSAGDPIGTAVPPAVMLGILLVSYALQPKVTASSESLPVGIPAAG